MTYKEFYLCEKQKVAVQYAEGLSRHYCLEGLDKYMSNRKLTHTTHELLKKTAVNELDFLTRYEECGNLVKVFQPQALGGQNFKEIIEPLLGHLVADNLHEDKCTICAEGDARKGYFKSCRTVDGFFRGACTNCRAARLTGACSFRQPESLPHNTHAPAEEEDEMAKLLKQTQRLSVTKPPMSDRSKEQMLEAVIKDEPGSSL